MAHRPPRSLKHEYELYVEQEIEGYKDSVPRSSLLKIGDEAVANLRAREQLALDELLIWHEVDRIIAKRLRLPSYDTWRRRRLKNLEAIRKPERWGLSADAPIVRMAQPADPGRVLVAEGSHSPAPLYLAANGHRVTTVAPDATIVQRILSEAEAAGIGERVEGMVADLRKFRPHESYALVVCTAGAMSGLSEAECDRVIAALQHATAEGGLHLLEFVGTDQGGEALKRRYAGWEIAVSGSGAQSSMVARKGAA
jgi:hypothetical protein